MTNITDTGFTAPRQRAGSPRLDTDAGERHKIAFGLLHASGVDVPLDVDPTTLLEATPAQLAEGVQRLMRQAGVLPRAPHDELDARLAAGVVQVIADVARLPADEITPGTPVTFGYGDLLHSPVLLDFDDWLRKGKDVAAEVGEYLKKIAEKVAARATQIYEVVKQLVPVFNVRCSNRSSSSIQVLAAPKLEYQLADLFVDAAFLVIGVGELKAAAKAAKIAVTLPEEVRTVKQFIQVVKAVYKMAKSGRDFGKNANGIIEKVKVMFGAHSTTIDRGAARSILSRSMLDLISVEGAAALARYETVNMTVTLPDGRSIDVDTYLDQAWIVSDQGLQRAEEDTNHVPEGNTIEWRAA